MHAETNAKWDIADELLQYSLKYAVHKQRRPIVNGLVYRVLRELQLTDEVFGVLVLAPSTINMLASISGKNVDHLATDIEEMLRFARDVSSTIHSFKPETFLFAVSLYVKFCTSLVQATPEHAIDAFFGSVRCTNMAIVVCVDIAHKVFDEKGPILNRMTKLLEFNEFIMKRKDFQVYENYCRKILKAALQVDAFEEHDRLCRHLEFMFCSYLDKYSGDVIDAMTMQGKRGRDAVTNKMCKVPFDSYIQDFKRQRFDTST